MKYKFGLIAVSVIVGAVLYSLTGGPVDEGSRLTPLLSGEQVIQKTDRRGLTASLARASGFEKFGPSDTDRSFHSDITFFETALSYGANTDPRNTFLLVNAYLAHNQQAYGIAFFERLLKRYENKFDKNTRATYLAAYAILRATYADNVPLISRIDWVLDTFNILDEAKILTNNSNPIVRWSAGLIYAQVPFFFFKKEQAYSELNWLAERPESEPISGFYREVYHHLAKLHKSDGDTEAAAVYLEKSGYDDYQPKSLFMGWFTTTRGAGAAMAAKPTLEELVSGRVFALYGFGFSDVYFVLSDDGNELIAVDSGTQPASYEAAQDFLNARHQNLPPVTTVIITHAHWDHIGGLTRLKALNPNLKVYGRQNFAGTLDRVQRNHSYKQFRGEGFDRAWVKDYKPDFAISGRTDISVGGTSIELIPVKGGETEDALLVHLPDLSAMFVGDILMPYYGEPWVEEGFIDGAIDTMDEVIMRAPKLILHGHRPLTTLYGPDQIEIYRNAYKWLVDTAREHIRNGYSVKDITRLNLIPPGLEKHPEVYASYLAPRDHIIARTADHMLGIWQEDITGQEPEGLYNLTSREYGRLMQIYLDLSAGEVADALRKMLEGGDTELALHLAVAAENRYPSDKAILRLKEEAADRLRSAAQFLDPFKLVTYTEMIGKEHKPVSNAPIGQAFKRQTR